MFTSRAEYRLGLREDNARDRLFGYAREYGLVSDKAYGAFQELKRSTSEEIRRLKRTTIPVARLDGLADHFVKKEHVTLADLLKVPGASYSDVVPFLREKFGDMSLANDEIIERAAIAIKYEGYIKKQAREVEKFRRLEDERIPDGFVFDGLTGLRNEAREKFIRFKPASLGQAGRIEGVTTGDLAALSVHIKKFRDHKRLSSTG